MENFINQIEYVELEEDNEYKLQFIQKNKKEVEQDLLERKAINIFSDINSFLERIGLYKELCQNLTIDKILSIMKFFKVTMTH